MDSWSVNATPDSEGALGKFAFKARFMICSSRPTNDSSFWCFSSKIRCIRAKSLDLPNEASSNSRFFKYNVVFPRQGKGLRRGKGSDSVEEIYGEEGEEDRLEAKAKALNHHVKALDKAKLCSGPAGVDQNKSSGG